jgi:hypothetical protein
MKLWIDDVRPAPDGDWLWIKSANKAIAFIEVHRPPIDPIEIISLDHDAGEFYYEGGDYIKVLNRMEWMSRCEGKDFSRVQFHLHSMNPVGVANMRAIIERNGWKEVK